jgi:hypothetical protein
MPPPITRRTRLPDKDISNPLGGVGRDAAANHEEDALAG